jgi:hypothetical protein
MTGSTGGPGVEITAVSQPEQPSDRLRGGFIDRPRAGDLSDTLAFEIEGWALGRDHEVTAVELLSDGKRLWRVPLEISRPDVATAHPEVTAAERSGFYGPVGALTMPQEFELEVRALLGDGSHTPLGSVAGRRAPLRSSFHPRLQPLMITTLGRTGSTALIRTLSAHPGVVSYRPFDYETKVATYWIDILRSLSEPASYLRQLSHARNVNDRRWWLGTLGEEYAVERQTRRTVPRPLPDRPIERWMGMDAVGALAEFCQSRIDALYREVAVRFGSPDAAYFAEKYPPRPATPSLLWEIYPHAREIVLVRDFRDVVSSMIAFDAKRGDRAFGREHLSSDLEYVERSLKSNALTLLRNWRRRSDRAHLLRYEDLILRPAETLQSVLSYLELDAGGGTIDAMLAALRERDEQTEWHRTTRDQEASIGRWREDLSPELRRACEAALGPVLEEFGYAPEGVAGAVAGGRAE